MIALDLFDNDSLTELDMAVTKYVNRNVQSIIRVLLDYLEGNNGFTSEDFLPYNNYGIDDATWVKMTYDLYDIFRSDVIRDYIKPKYQYLLYVILQWWEDCNDILENLLDEMDSDLFSEIQSAYTLENGDNYVLNSVTNFEDYYYIFFADHDFLPTNLERLITIYLRNPKLFVKFFPDTDLKEYRDLMPNDLREQFDELTDLDQLVIKNVSEASLLTDILFCSERLQANHSYKEALEDNMNDYIRDLLTAMQYSLRDQTRQGTSSGGKQAGEVDILIKKDNLPYSIIEALRLSSVDETLISEHIDKIYKYDTLGNACNFIISYVKAKNFSQFWEKYKSYTKSYDYPFELIQYIVYPDKQHSELKYSFAELKRNAVKTRLYHIAIHIPN